MPTYEYHCDKCDHSLEVFQTFAEFKELKKCPNCKKNGLYQVFDTIHSFVYQDPKTLGHQADRNTKKMGSYELQEKRQKDKIATKLQRKKPLIEKGLIAAKDAMKDRKTPWYGELPKEKRGVVDNLERAKEYIQKGT